MDTPPPPGLRTVPSEDRRTAWRAIPWDWSDQVGFLLIFIGAVSIVWTLLLSAPMRHVAAAVISNDGVRHALGSFLLYLLYDGLALAVLLTLVLYRRRGSTALVGWRLPTKGWIAGALGIGILAYFGVVILAGVIQSLFPNAHNGQIAVYQNSFGSYEYLLIPISVLLAPAVEETYFRG